MWNLHPSKLYMTADIIKEDKEYDKNYCAYKEISTGKIEITHNNSVIGYAVEKDNKLIMRNNCEFIFVE